MNVLRFLLSKRYREKQRRGTRREVKKLLAFILLRVITQENNYSYSQTSPFGKKTNKIS